MGPRRMGKARRSPFARELGGKARPAVTAHSYDTGGTSAPALGQPRGPALGRSWTPLGWNGGQMKQECPAIQKNEWKVQGVVAFGTKWCQHVTVKGLHFSAPLRDRSHSQFCHFLKRKLHRSNLEVAWLLHRFLKKYSLAKGPYSRVVFQKLKCEHLLLLPDSLSPDFRW